MKKNKNVKEIWKRIEKWLIVEAPTMAEGLYEGAREEEIKEAEYKLGVRFPNDFVESYLIHNGQPREQRLFDGWSLRSLESIIKNWQNLKNNFDLGIYQSFPTQSNGKVKAQWWHPAWIAFTDSWSGDSHCLDLSPTECGQIGQVFRYWHDAPERIWLAPNFAAFLELFANDLYQGKYHYSSVGKLELVNDP